MSSCSRSLLREDAVHFLVQMCEVACLKLRISLARSHDPNQRIQVRSQAVQTLLSKRSEELWTVRIINHLDRGTLVTDVDEKTDAVARHL